MLMVSFGDKWQPYATNVCFEEKLVISLVSYEMWKETPQFGTTMRANDSIWKIKDLSSLKCHKEMNDTWFS